MDNPSQLDIIPQIATPRNEDIFNRQTYCKICGTPLPLPTRNGGRPFIYCPEHTSWGTGRSNGRWSSTMRIAILKRDGCKCIYCGANTTQIDHVYPVLLGGPTDTNNGVVCCGKCNSVKSWRIDKRGINHLIKKGENVDWLKSIKTIVYCDKNLGYAISPMATRPTTKLIQSSSK